MDREEDLELPCREVNELNSAKEEGGAEAYSYICSNLKKLNRSELTSINGKIVKILDSKQDLSPENDELLPKLLSLWRRVPDSKKAEILALASSLKSQTTSQL